MPRYIVKLAENEYVEWSTVVAAPVSDIEVRDDAAAKFGADNVALCDENGHSASWMPERGAEFLVAGNRAGYRERELTLDEIRRVYRKRET